MNALRIYLILILAVVGVYTAGTVGTHGLGFLPVFFGDIAEQAWPGQFNLDFLCMLSLSGLWVAWRHRFSAAGLGLGLLAFFGGAPFLCVYLLVNSWRSAGDVRQLLLGERGQG